MSAMTTVLFSRWSDPRHPLYVAMTFQVAIFVLIFVDLQSAATALAGGTIGCLVALCLQRDQRAPLR